MVKQTNKTKTKANIIVSLKFSEQPLLSEIQCNGIKWNFDKNNIYKYKMYLELSKIAVLMPIM